MGALTFLFFFNSFFFKSIVACRLCDIYVREENDSLKQGPMLQLYVNQKKESNFNRWNTI